MTLEPAENRAKYKWLVCGMLLLAKSKWVTLPVHYYVEIFRCTPLLVQIVWFYYAFPILLGIEIQAWVAALTALSLYAGAFYAEVFRGGIVSYASDVKFDVLGVPPGPVVSEEAAAAMAQRWRKDRRGRGRIHGSGVSLERGATMPH